MQARVAGPDASRLPYRVPEAMAVLRLSRTVIYELLRSGRLRSVHEGRTRVIPAEALRDYVEQLVREAV